MKVTIVSVAYNLPDSTKRLFETSMLDSDKHDIDFLLFLHSFHPETEAMCMMLEQQYPCKLYYDEGPIRNRGLSTSWNEGMTWGYQNGADVVIIANDDIFFSPGDIDKIALKAVSCRKNYMISTAGPHLGAKIWEPSHGYSSFAINPIALEKIGMFDHNIFPVYMEDCDHHRRATLLGLFEENCSDTMVSHGGSGAINKPDNSGRILSLQNMVTHRKNSDYYQLKWGGVNEHEKFTTPFGDPNTSLYIPWERRFNPYGPGRDREDRNFVRV